MTALALIASAGLAGVGIGCLMIAHGMREEARRLSVATQWRMEDMRRQWLEANEKRAMRSRAGEASAR